MMRPRSIRALLAIAILLLQVIGPYAHHAFGHSDHACAHHAACDGLSVATTIDGETHDCPVCAFISHAAMAMDVAPAGSPVPVRDASVDVMRPATRPSRTTDFNVAGARAPPR